MSFLKSFFGTSQSASDTAASAIDVVTYVASLASDPKAVDPILDQLRDITSRLQPGQSLSAADQTKLAGVCLQLENHLIQHDPLRNFDQATIDAKIRQKFPSPAASEASFWAKLGVVAHHEKEAA